MQEQEKLTLTRRTYRNFLYGSLGLFGLFFLTFLFLPYALTEASATNRVDAEVDWGSVSLTFDPDVEATQAGTSTVGDSGHGDVDFGVLTPTDRSSDNRRTMKVLRRRLGVETTGKYYTVYLSSVDNKTSLDLATTLDNSDSPAQTAFTIPAVGDGETSGTFSSPTTFGNTASWGYAVPGVENTGIPSAPSTFVVPALIGQQINGQTDTAGAAQTYNQTTWSALAPRSNPQQIWKSQTSNITGFDEGETFDVYYGVLVNTDTLAGNYSREIVYTALASAASLDRVSSNISHSRDAGGRGDLVGLTIDLADSLGTITKSMVHVALVPHSVMEANKTNLDEYVVSNLNFSDYASCPIASLAHGDNNEYITLSCVLPESEEGTQYDFWVKINDYNIDYVSKDYSGNNLVASFTYAGLQTEFPASDARSGSKVVTEMQDMTEGVCSLSNAWGTGTGTDARVYNYTGTGETLGVATSDTDQLMNIGTFPLTDNRDNKTYLVRRLADGNCWMVQNLDLDLASFAGTENLTYKNTDLNSKDVWDPSASALAIAKTYDPTVTQENYFETFALNRLGNAQKVQFQPKGIYGTVDGVTYYWGSKVGDNGETLDTVTHNAQSEVPRSYDNELDFIVGLADSPLVGTDTSYNSTHGSQYVGDYYNWYAATAESGTFAMTSGDANDSICPSGWGLPLQHETGLENRSYPKLINAYTGISQNTADLPQEKGDALWLVPVSLGFSGVMNANADASTPGVTNIGGMSRYTNLWASTAHASVNRYASNLLVNRNYGSANVAYIYPRYRDLKDHGFSVRCVSRGTTLPSDYEAEIATTCSAGKICYDGNGATEGSMTDQSAESNTSTMLTAPLYKKTGYAFAGWSTEENGFGEIYGPNQILTTPDLSSKGMQLYAKWVPSVGEFQTWTGCSAMDEDQVIGLTDSRDGKTYSVAKLKDGNCWMTQNLNLDLASFAGTNNLTSSNTDLNSKSTWDPSASTETKINSTYASELSARGLSSDFTGLSTLLLGQAQPAQFQTSDQTGYWWSSKVSDDGSYTALDEVTNNSNSEIPRTYVTARGELYNWYAATAESGTYAFDVLDEAEDSVCPSGWRLPTDAANGSVIPKSWRGLMNDTLGINAATSATDEDFTTLSSYPLSLMFDGNYHHQSGNYYPIYSGNYWTSLKTSAISARNLNYNTIESIIRPGDASNKTYGLSVRCVQR